MICTKTVVGASKILKFDVVFTINYDTKTGMCENA